jgi:hypothetical protein
MEIAIFTKKPRCFCEPFATGAFLRHSDTLYPQPKSVLCGLPFDAWDRENTSQAQAQAQARAQAQAAGSGFGVRVRDVGLWKIWGEAGRLFGVSFGQYWAAETRYWQTPTLLTRSYMLCMCLPPAQPIAFLVLIFVVRGAGSALASPSCSNGTYEAAAHASPHASSGSTNSAAGRAEQVGTAEGAPYHRSRARRASCCCARGPELAGAFGGIDGPALEPW